MKCIYCLQEKPPSAYSKVEHVIPQAFGLFKNNLTLKDTVCDACNEHFGKTLDIALARDTVEGILRFEHVLKESKDFKSLGKKSRMIIQLPDGELKGSYAYPEYSEEHKRIMVYPCPQIGFLKGSTRIFFLLNNIPDRETLLQEFNFQHPQAILYLGCDPNVADQILKERGVTIKFGPEMSLMHDNGAVQTVDCHVDVTIDKVIMRAVAKIAFNYLAYFEGHEFVLHHDFNNIRIYILNGLEPDYPLVRIEQKAILGDEPENGSRRSGHILTTNFAKDDISILAQVSLMNWMKYSVSLARNFTGKRRPIQRGHFFNYHSGDILLLTTEKPLTSK